jgi:hypothetical protein
MPSDPAGSIAQRSSAWAAVLATCGQLANQVWQLQIDGGYGKRHQHTVYPWRVFVYHAPSILRVWAVHTHPQTARARDATISDWAEEGRPMHTTSVHARAETTCGVPSRIAPRWHASVGGYRAHPCAGERAQMAVRAMPAVQALAMRRNTPTSRVGAVSSSRSAPLVRTLWGLRILSMAYAPALSSSVRGPPTTCPSDTSWVERARALTAFAVADLVHSQAARAASTLGRSAPLGLGMGTMRVTAQRRTALQVMAAVAADAPVQKQVRHPATAGGRAAGHPTRSVSAAVWLREIHCAVPTSGGWSSQPGTPPGSHLVAP